MPDPLTKLRLRPGPPGPQQVGNWRETVSPLWAVEVERDQAEHFTCRSDVFNLGTCILGNTAATAHRTERSRGLIARMGVDHVLVQMRLSGRAQVRARRHEHDLSAGDVLLLDLSQDLFTRASDYEAITLALPRQLFASTVRDPDELHGSIIRGSTPLGVIVGSHLRILSAQAPRLSSREAVAAVEATAGLIAACADPSLSPSGRDAARPGALLVTRRFIEEHLAAPHLNAGLLARRFGLSRSALYRLFEPLGGVAAYIRRRRLARAYADLADPRPASVQQVALRWCFASPAHFVQAFRQEFGCTPSAVRGSSRTSTQLSGYVEHERESMLFDWVMNLGA